MSQSKQRLLQVRRANLRRRTRRRDRRGVLLMVVLSMLALFLLLGTAFLMTSQFYRTSSEAAAKENRTENNPYDLMERAMLQVLRDTNNPSSSIRHHSLLRDMYGADGFVARIFPEPATYFCEYSGNNQFGSATPAALGPTNGQFIDLYVGDYPLAGPLAEAANVVKLDRNPDGTPVDHVLPAATGYYNGCLLTMLEGAAAGQSTRILDYRLMNMVESPGGTLMPVFRLRVMSFPRADGALLSATDLAALAGNAFMVNGRPHNGTGAGLNRLATRGKPKLSAVELMPLDGQFVGTEIALTPNGRYVDYTQAAHYLGTNFTPGGDPFRGTNGGGYPLTDFVSLNSNRDTLLYPTADGPGGSDESYDAVDYQNMFLAHMPLSPRATAGLLGVDTGLVDLGNARTARVLLGDTDQAMRFDTENMIIPSYHRPALVNYWFHRLHTAPWLVNAISDENQRAAAIISPYSYQPPGNPVADAIVAIKRKISLRPIPEDHPNFDGSNPASRYRGTALVPDPNSRSLLLAANGQIRFPFWEAVGPWDVDNDNDGINDSVWLDLGDPVQEREDGTLFKAMYAFLVVDLDNRLNVNAIGSSDHFANTNFDPLHALTSRDDIVGNDRTERGNLAGGDQWFRGMSNVVWTSNLMPVGMGWGPGDGSLRSILSPLTQPYNANYLSSFNPYNGDPTADDYARLLYGRMPADPNSDAIWGRLGSTYLLAASGAPITPGRALNPSDLNTVAATREPLVPFEFFEYPMADRMRSERLGVPLLAQPSAFAISPDLRGRYATGIDYTGQPVYEPTYDAGGNLLGVQIAALLDDSPYETDLTSDGRRGLPGAVTPQDDALFATSEMERILRAYDPETGTAPSRLWDIVDTFDPSKYVLTIASDTSNITPEEWALAQTETAIKRQEVTTESLEAPVPADVVPSYITELGPDGAPGNAGVDDDGIDSDNNGNNDDDPVLFNVRSGQGEIGWYAVQDSSNPSLGLYLLGWSDDFSSLTGKSVAEARLVDVLWYRIQRHRAKLFLTDGQTRPYNWNNPQAVAILSNISNQLLPPEVLAGYKMDLNRPFGNGADDNGNGIVDEPIEAGEPYDSASGKFIDLNGNRVYDPPTDRLWSVQLGGAGVPVDAVMSQDVAQAPFTDSNGNGQLDVAGGELQVDVDADGNPDVAQPVTVRNDAHLARQLYARHLYMLMLVLMDEDYVMPYDPSDPSARAYLRVKAIQLKASSGMTDYQAKLEAQRRYTCRQIAQWAVNCVDFRDSDVSNTPFEFDENPWDGWGNINDNGTKDDPTDDIYFPLDGDPTTNENFQQVIDWQNMGANGVKVITNPVPSYGPGSNQQSDEQATRSIVWGVEKPELLISETAAFHDLRLEDRASTRKPGDNTTQDDDPQLKQDNDLDQRLRPRGSLFVEIYNPNSGDSPKAVELYRHADYRLHPVDRNGDGNINDLDEFHWADVNGNGQFDQGEQIEGVLLDRLSDVGRLDPDSGMLQRSPVWRLVVVEEHPGYHSATGAVSDETIDPNMSSADPLNGTKADSPKSVYDYSLALDRVFKEREQIPYLSPMNMDWEEMWFIPPLLTGGFTPGAAQPRWPLSSWQQARTDDRVVTNEMTPDNMPGRYNRQLFAKPYPYIEREFYFTSNNSKFHCKYFDATGSNPRSFRGATARGYTDLDTTQRGTIYNDLKVRIPVNPIRVDRNLVSYPFRFVSTETDDPRPDVRIAPVMPGRYAVIGSAGTLYDDKQRVDPDDGNSPLRFITTLGRNFQGAGTEAETDDMQHTSQLRGTRRFEMHPSANPYQQQWVVGSNGATFHGGTGAAVRSNELMYVNDADPPLNMTGDGGAVLQGASRVAAPTIVVPVDDMNISEPVYGYGVRERELTQLQAGKGNTGQRWNPHTANGEGSYTNNQGDAHFDSPFDVAAFQAAQNSPVSFKKFRVVHLQRLADPTMPWNPAPDYKVHSKALVVNYGVHDPALPVNPYLTVDSASVDLTVFNGTSSVNVGMGANSANKGFGSTERMFESRRTVEELNGTFAVQQRAMMNQDYFLASDRLLPPEENSMLIPATGAFLMSQAVKDEHEIAKNHSDYFFKHSLGLPNEAMGDFYVRPESGVGASLPAAVDPTDLSGDDGNVLTMGSALGAPRPDAAAGGSTYPWLNWTNRPFVSESELLQVPAWSSMELLRKFTTINPIEQIDPYVNEGAKDASGNDISAVSIETGSFANVDAEQTNVARYKAHVAGFGALLNMMQSSRYPARVLQDTDGNPVPVGAPNFHRILDYVHTPSRFVATDTLLNPATFNSASVSDANDPRVGHLAPFNRVANYREPGKVNLNTVASQREAGSSAYLLWSDVFDGLMHRTQDLDPAQRATGLPFGHFGPAWRDVVLSRRGFADPLFSNGVAPGGVDRVDLVMDARVPTFFSNPFRSGEAGDLVPLSAMVQHGTEATMLRSHPFQPGSNFVWGGPGSDNGSALVNDSREAGIGAADGNPFNKQSDQASVPLFSELCSAPAIDATRNSAMHYGPLTRLDNMTTTRSGVFAIWVTVGYFEVTAAPEVDWNDTGDMVRQKFMNQAAGDLARAQALYNKVYPEGYQLGKELGSDIGNVERHRAFYIIDRTKPVAFKPGEDVNVEDAILLRRRIE